MTYKNNNDQNIDNKLKTLENKLDEVLKQTKVDKEREELMDRLRAIKGTGVH